MVTNAAFGRASRGIVLHAITGENLHLAVVELDGDGNLHHPFWRAQDLPQSLIDLQKFSRHIKLNLSDAEGVEILPRSHFRNHRLRDSFGDRSHPVSPCTAPGAPCSSRLLPRVWPSARSAPGSRRSRSA